MLRKVLGAIGVAHSDIEGFLKEDHLMKKENYQFMNYISTYNKSYGTKAEYQFREQQFIKNLEKIAQHESKNGNTFTLGIN